MKAEHILITGASSGIGRMLALKLAGPGRTLHLGGRNTDRLERVAQLCRDVGAQAIPHRRDVRDADGMNEWISGIHQLDLAFACAGITGGTRRGPHGVGEDAGQVRRIIATNVDGVVNTVLPAIARMRHQRLVDGVRGRICAISSVAGFVSYPSTPAYCASKAAVDRLMVSMAGSLRPEGLVLTSVCCGFVDTPMVAGNLFPMPGLVSANVAAAKILRGVSSGNRRIVFPWWLGAGSRFIDLLPFRIADAIYFNQPIGQVDSLAETGLDINPAGQVSENTPTERDLAITEGSVTALVLKTPNAPIMHPD